MKLYYFDIKGGVPLRDQSGIEFNSVFDAIAHSRGLARELREGKRIKDKALIVSVINESGVEIHQEKIAPTD